MPDYCGTRSNKLFSMWPIVVIAYCILQLFVVLTIAPSVARPTHVLARRPKKNEKIKLLNKTNWRRTGKWIRFAVGCVECSFNPIAEHFIVNSATLSRPWSCTRLAKTFLHSHSSSVVWIFFFFSYSFSLLQFENLNRHKHTSQSEYCPCEMRMPQRPLRGPAELLA